MVFKNKRIVDINNYICFELENDLIMKPTIEDIKNAMIKQVEDKGFTVSSIKYINEDGKLVEIKNNH